MKNAAFVLLSAFSVFAMSCQKQEEASGQASAVLAVRLKPSNTTTVFRLATTGTVSARTEGLNLQWTKAQASASLLKFEAEKGGSEIEFKSTVQQTIDLFNASANLGNLSIKPDTYDEVELKAVLSPVNAAPALQMEGTVTTGNGSVPVRFVANETIEVRGEKKNVTITGSTIQSADIPLNFSMVVKGISLAEMENAVQSGGSILISSSSNASLYAKMVKNLRELKEESEFHK